MTEETSCPPHRWRITDAENDGAIVHRHECLTCGLVEDRSAQSPPALFDDARRGHPPAETDGDALRSAGQAISNMLRRMKEQP